METMPTLSDRELLARMPTLVRAERAASAEVIAHLMEIERRQLYLGEACSSLFAYCRERLGYSEDEALKRMRVARMALDVPAALDELRSGAIHLTGLFVLSRYVTPENADELLGEARGKSRRELERLLARLFPRPDVAERIAPIAGLGAGGVVAGPGASGVEFRGRTLSPPRVLQAQRRAGLARPVPRRANSPRSSTSRPALPETCAGSTDVHVHGRPEI